MVTCTCRFNIQGEPTLRMNANAKPFTFGDPSKAKEFVPSWMPALKPSTEAVSTTPSFPPPTTTVPSITTTTVKTTTNPPATIVKTMTPAPAMEEKKVEPVTNIKTISTPPAPVVEAITKAVKEVKIVEGAEEKDIEDMNDEELEAFIKKQEALEAMGIKTGLKEEDEVIEEVKEEAKEEVAKPKVVIVDADPREHMNIVTIGHVDAGKSTISGNLLVLTGQVDKRVIEKFEREAKERNRESWFLAYVMDTSEDERAKGITIEVGRARFATESKRFTLLDCPGHKNYIPNMIAGASQADVGILVISARKGEFEAGFEKSGQTREHALLAKTLGVKKLVVLINKMDEVTVKWSKERFDGIQSKLGAYLKQCGFGPKDVDWIPISGIYGQNLKDRYKSKESAWYTGPSLLELLDGFTMPHRNPDDLLRVPVLDSYQDRGLVAMGKVESGTLSVGMKVLIVPGNKEAEILSVTVDDDTREVFAAKPGENMRCKLKGVTEEDIHKGFVICSPIKPTVPVIEFEANLALLELSRPIFTAGSQCMFHAHTGVEECVVTKLLLEVISTKEGKSEKKFPKFVRSNSKLVCRIKLEMSMALETFEQYPALGRFSLRDEGRTIGIGKIVKLIK